MNPGDRTRQDGRPPASSPTPSTGRMPPPARRRPVFLVMVAFFAPLAWYGCKRFTDLRASPDFLGFDSAKAVFRSHLPASLVALALVMAALVRNERPRWLSIPLAIAVLLWFIVSYLISRP